MDNKNTNEKYVEVWEDLVALKSLLLAIIVCSVTTMSAYLIAPDVPPKPLLFGLGGAFLGFVILSFIIKPKRRLSDEEVEK